MTTTSSPDDESLKSQVAKELEEAKGLAKSLDFEKVKTGEWFIALLKQVVKAYDRNAKAAYFQKKYPGLDAVSQIEDVELRKVLIELLTLMAIYDGSLVNEEREFLMNAAERLGGSLDIAQVEKRTKEYQVIVEKNVLEKKAGVMGSAAVTAIGAAGQAANKFKDALGKAVKQKDGGTSSTSPAAVQDDPVKRLKKLKQMFEAGLITQAGFRQNSVAQSRP